MRFFVIRPTGLDKLAASLAVCDSAHYAVAAFDGTRCIGIANFIISPGKTNADIAVAVATDYQNQGIGAELLKRISVEALKRDVSRFEADILCENSAVQHLLNGQLYKLDYQCAGSRAHLSVNLKY